MYDIKQQTKKDYTRIESIGGITYYCHTLSGDQIYKFGFIGNESAIGYNLILKVDDRTTTIKLGKTGMYELSPEIFKDINDEESEEKNVLLNISEVWVPIPKNKYNQDITDFEYIIDYAIQKTVD